MKKRMISLLLSLVFVFTLLPMSVFAAEPEVVKSYHVATLYDDGTLEIFADVSNLAAIPWQNERASIKKVVFTVETQLYPRLFTDCANLVEVTLPSAITEIPQRCFNNCTSLTSIAIPDTVTSIGERAFSDCEKLSSITFGVNSQLQTIGNSAFNNCDVLTSIAIPDTVTSIGGSAFNSCYALASIVIPDSVTSIGERAFSDCKKLSSITFGVNSQLQTIGVYAFNNCDVLESIAIPDTVNSIGDSAFNSCDTLTSIAIPDSVTSIGERAFSDCKKLSSITFGVNSQLQTIGVYAFNNCDVLTSIVIPDTVNSIGIGAFNSCDALTDIYYEGTVESWNSITKGNDAIPSGVKINHTGDCVDTDTNHICDVCVAELTHDYPTEWKSDGTNHWQECSCGAKSDEAAHSGGTATCTEKAVCETCGTAYGEANPDAHDWGNWLSNNDGTHTRTCANDASHTETNACSGGTATCTEKAKCTACATEYGNLAEHSYSDDWTYDANNHWHAATCSHEVTSDTAEHSYGSDRTCDTCGYTKPAPYIPPSEPTWRPDVDCGENGDVTVSPRYPEQGDRVTITTDPDKGYEVDEVIVTDRRGDEVRVTDNGDGTYRFRQPYGKVTITVTFKKEVCSGGADCPIGSFTDLDFGAWYHDGIHYCVEQGLMQGVGGDSFDPNGTTSRAMIWTILARLDGVDTDGEVWYEAGRKWAVENAISDGTMANDPITREQLATILWRYAKYKGYDVSVGENTNILSYEDAFDISEYAIPAMQWACGAGVIGGIEKNNSMYLDPQGSATRAQAATMIIRFCEMKK